MGKRGRPPVLDEQKRGQILAILSVGCSQNMAAQYVGCAASTIQRTAERDPKFAKSPAPGEVQRRAGAGEKHPQRGQEGAILAGGSLGPGTRVPRKICPPRPRRDHGRTARPAAWRSLPSVIVQHVPNAEYRKNIVKDIGALARSLGQTIKEEVAAEVIPSCETQAHK